MTSALKVTVYWGDILYDTAIYRPRQTITLGPNPENTFVLDSGSSKPRFELVRVHRNGTAEIQFNDQIEGHVRLGDELVLLRNAKKLENVSQDSEGNYRLSL